jgi:CRP-like cAMP-binding protein
MGGLANRPRCDNATVIADADLVLISRERYFEMIQEHPALGVKLTSGIFLSVSNRLQMSYERLAAVF